MSTLKLHKWLADCGIASRRQAESLIEQGLITVNKKTAFVGQRIDPDTDTVLMRGRPVRHKKSITQVLLYHKPEGKIVTRSDPEGRPTIFSDLPRPPSGRWISVGRLDINSSGLLLITNDGALAHTLMHPSTNIEREYAVRLRGTLSDEMITQLKAGVTLEDGAIALTDIRDQGGQGHNHWYHLTLTSGRNRIIRRLMEHFGRPVSRLIRVRYAHIKLPSYLKKGQINPLSEADIETLKAL